MRRGRTALGFVATAAATLFGAGALAGSGATTTAAATLVSTYPIATFTPAAETTHNNQGSSVCGTFQASEPVSENHGDLNAAKGSYLERVGLADGTVVQRLGLYANDFDSDGDIYVFLVRKLLMPGLSPQFNGYHVMGRTNSSDAVLNTMRHFVDRTVGFNKIDNERFEYYLEVVNCAVTEPFAAQIVFTK